MTPETKTGPMSMVQLALRSMAMDIFPEINIPVISIIWALGGDWQGWPQAAAGLK